MTFDQGVATTFLKLKDRNGVFDTEVNGLLRGIR